MYELNNRIRLIDVAEYPISNCDEFMGFLCGILSQDRDMEEMYLDSFLTISSLKEDEMTYAIKKLAIISEKFSVKFVLSVSKDEKDLPECARARIILSL